MQVCPKCCAHYADCPSGFCPVDGTPVVKVEAGSDQSREGSRAIEEKQKAQLKKRRRLKWRRLVLATIAVLVATRILYIVAFKSYVYEPPHTVKGQVKDQNGPLAGVTLNLEGGQKQGLTRTTDENGDYTFADLSVRVKYTITPVMAAVTFTPANYVIEALNQDERADFVVSPEAPQFFKIFGQVTSPDGVFGSVKLEISASPNSVSTETDPKGNYAFEKLPAGAAYTITPFSEATTFSPPKKDINKLNQDVQVDFIAVIARFKISGRVTTQPGPPVQVELQLEGGTKPESTLTDAKGNYAFNDLAGGLSYTITPVGPKEMHFNQPPWKTSKLMGDAHANFTGIREPSLFKIRGHVTLPPGMRVVVTFKLGGAKTASTTADADGNYSFPGLPEGGKYTISPYSQGIKFDPPPKEIQLTSDKQVDFVAKPPPPKLYKIIGHVTWPAVIPGNVFLQLEGNGRNIRRPLDKEGNYSFDKLPEGHSYTITPAGNMMKFKPPNGFIPNLSQDERVDFDGVFTPGASDNRGSSELPINRGLVKRRPSSKPNQSP